MLTAPLAQTHLRHPGSASGGARRDQAPSFDEAFRSLFTERFKNLSRYLHRLTGDAALADDVAQEAFVRLYQRGSMPDAPSSWLISVANNLVRDEHRRTARRRRLLTLWEKPSPPRQEPETELLAAERSAQVRSVLGALPHRQQQLLLLRHAGYSYDEIARALELSPGSVGTLLVRATAAFVAAYRRANHASD